MLVRQIVASQWLSGKPMPPSRFKQSVPFLPRKIDLTRLDRFSDRHLVSRSDDGNDIGRMFQEKSQRDGRSGCLMIARKMVERFPYFQPLRMIWISQFDAGGCRQPPAPQWTPRH